MTVEKTLLEHVKETRDVAKALRLVEEMAADETISDDDVAEAAIAALTLVHDVLVEKIRTLSTEDGYRFLREEDPFGEEMAHCGEVVYSLRPGPYERVFVEFVEQKVMEELLGA